MAVVVKSLKSHHRRIILILLSKEEPYNIFRNISFLTEKTYLQQVNKKHLMFAPPKRQVWWQTVHHKSEASAVSYASQ